MIIIYDQFYSTMIKSVLSLTFLKLMLYLSIWSVFVKVPFDLKNVS